MSATTRAATFAGRFYPENASEIQLMLGKLLAAESSTIKKINPNQTIIGGIVPHAGWIFSGYQAIHVYESIKQSKTPIDTVVIVNPNHTGYGSGNFNIGGWDFWDTPLGKIEIDNDFSAHLGITINNEAHFSEHSGEVQLPFLKHFIQQPFKLVMITMNVQSAENAHLLATKINQAQKATNNKILLLASSDFSHYEKPTECEVKDQLLIDQIIDKNTSGIEKAVRQNRISACGFGPIMTLIEYARLLREHFTIELLRKGNSGEIYPSDKVVGYASFLCTVPN